jgi:hypothetical protein
VLSFVEAFTDARSASSQFLVHKNVTFKAGWNYCGFAYSIALSHGLLRLLWTFRTRIAAQPSELRPPA